MTATTPKAEETRERIVDAALRLFRDKGFDETTMRDVAAEAGIATGGAYYYFRSKEELVMALYARTSDEARTLVPAALERTPRDLTKRLRAVIDTKFQQFAAHRRLLGALVRIGMDPKNPLSPFAKETEPMRIESIGYFRDALAGTKVPRDLEDLLPGLFWFYQLGLILFWIYDESPGQRKTERLTDATLDIAVRLISLSSLPLMSPLRKRVIALLNEVLD